MVKIGNRSVSEFRKFYNVPDWVEIECALIPRNVREIEDAHWIHILLLSQGGSLYISLIISALFLHNVRQMSGR